MSLIEAHLVKSGEDDGAPSHSDTVSSREFLHAIQERQTAFEGIVSAMKSTSLNDTDRAALRRYERQLQSLKNMAAKAEQGEPVNVDDLPPLPRAFKVSPSVRWC